MALSPLAGKPAPASLLIDVTKLIDAYHNRTPDLADARQFVSFGTSGHRGTSEDGSFTEAHIAAITQAICEYRAAHNVTGPLFMGKDTHALSSPAQETALEVLVANNVDTVIQDDNGFTPTPVISHAILTHNRGRNTRLADGIVITPSHNPPRDGGFKYNPPNGGPADTDITGWVQDRANDLLRAGNRDVKRTSIREARSGGQVQERDMIVPYVRDLAHVIDMEAIRAARLKLAVDPLGGASLPCWDPINSIYGLDIDVVNRGLDPRFAFMTVDHDGQIRMDCSSPYAMAGLVGLKDRYRVAFGNDPDSDRHGIVTPDHPSPDHPLSPASGERGRGEGGGGGLMNPNHYLAVAIRYLLGHRPKWPVSAAVGKTLVSSSLIDRVVAQQGRTLMEVPVGFKWFAPGLFDGSVCFGGEESAGASFLRHDGTVWTTDKDGIILDLLAAEITAKTGKDPGQHYQELTAQFGASYYTRIDAPATPEQKNVLKKLSPEMVKATTLAGDPITARLTKAPGNNAAIGGLKVTTANGWFAARPSGTENVYKIYAESLKNESHLHAIVKEAQEIVSAALAAK